MACALLARGFVAVAFVLAGRHAAAEELFARAQARSPDDASVRTGLALAQLERGRGDWR